MTEPVVIPTYRLLNAGELGIGYEARATAGLGSSAPDAPTLTVEDPRLPLLNRLVERFGGIIFTGPPGTGKSWLAREYGQMLANYEPSRVSFVQFHASYQFEDFMEGYRPRESGEGFESRNGVFLEIVDAARLNPAQTYVLVIDELSRGDVGRVFGEALTYIERSKRGLPFKVPSGKETAVPLNLVILATMNPLDKGVDDVDAAFERRFAKFYMPPDRGVLQEILERNEVDEQLRHRLLGWFSRINNHAANNPAAAVGHTYFIDVVDQESLRDVWDYQLQYHVDRAFRYEPEVRAEIIRGWASIFATDQTIDDADTGTA